MSENDAPKQQGQKLRWRIYPEKVNLAKEI